MADVEDFRNLVVRSGDTLVRCAMLHALNWGAEDYDTATWRKPGDLRRRVAGAGANLGRFVAKAVHKALDRHPQPAAVRSRRTYPTTPAFIQDLIDEVFTTLVEAVLIVLVVIFLSLARCARRSCPAWRCHCHWSVRAFPMLLLGYQSTR